MDNERKADDVAGLVERLRAGHDWLIHGKRTKVGPGAADFLAAAVLLESLTARVAELEAAADRYETVRRLNVPQFRDAFVLNTRTGKPFDEIIDDLRPFVRPDAIRQRAARG